MILDGVCYFAFIQFCRVILSRMAEPYCVSLPSDLLLVFHLTFYWSSLTLSGLDVCLDWYLGPIMFPPMLCC